MTDQRQEPGAGPGAESDAVAPGLAAEPDSRSTSARRWVALASGPVLGIIVYLLLPASLAHEARLTAGVATLMAVWWMSEAIPIPATALLPLVLFPVLGDQAVDDVGASYGNNIIFLFMGGFLLALAMQRWNLHRRIALLTVRSMGTRPSMVIAGFMIATGFMSMWVSNTATAVMMLPIGVSVLLLVTRLDGDADPEEALATNFGTALMLGIAYAASIGSLATIIGTPPNTLLVGYLSENQDIEIGFGQWMLLGLPLSIILLGVCWWVLTHWIFPPEMDDIPGGRQLMDRELAKLDTMSSAERRVLVIFVAAAASWISIPLTQDEPVISDAGIAMVVGLLLFIVPAGTQRGVRLLDWRTAEQLPWGVLLLFGGGLALSAQFTGSGLSDWIGEQAAGLGGMPLVLLVALVATGVLLLTELTSNTATAATFLPLAGGVALGLGLDPLLLTIPVALAASCAFMLPVATPPNAIAYGSGYVTIGQMIRGGVWLNIAALILTTLGTMTVAVWVFGIAL